MWLQRAAVVALVPYVTWMVFAYRWHFLDGANLLFHEGGHIVFLPFGQTLHMLGGTIAQLFFPAACSFHLWRQDRRFEAWVCGIWLAESTMYMAEYLADAKAQALPLVGGGTHDWHWILSRLGLVDWCGPIALVIHGFASLLAILCLSCAAVIAFEWGSESRGERSARLSGKCPERETSRTSPSST
jgi:hypothetical protein